MAKNTANFRLIQPEINDDIQVTINQLSDNFDEIDNLIHGSKEEISNASGGFSSLKKKLDGFVVHVADFGAKGDGTNDTVAIQAAIDFVNQQKVSGKRGGTILFGDSGYVANTLTIYNNINMVGKGKATSSLIKLSFDQGGTDEPLIKGVDTQYFSISDMSVQHQSGTSSLAGGLFHFSTSTDTNYITHVTIENCVISDTQNGRGDLILFYGLVRDINIRNNKITGYTNNASSTISTSLRFDNRNLFQARDDMVFVIGNIFRFGKMACGFEGSGYPPNVHFHNNVVYGQTNRGLNIYHGLNWNVTGNMFRDIYAAKRSNNDGGAVWLDCYFGDGTLTSQYQSNVFANNSVSNITGNAVFFDSFQGICANNEISKVFKRTNDTFTNTYTYEGVTTTHTSDGGHGIHMGGSNDKFLITGNKIRECEQSGIYINRALDIHQTYEVSGTIEGNDIQSNSNGIEIYEKVAELRVMNNHIEATNNGIRIHRNHETTNNVFGKGFFQSNVIKSINGINKTYGYGYAYVTGNIIQRESTGVALSWTFNQGSTIGNMNINNADKTVTTF